jgi:HK97 family phage portal protein
MAQSEKLGFFQRLGLRLLGKGLYNLHPELRWRVPVLRGEDGERRIEDNDWYYEQNVWVRKAINIIADNIAWLPIDVVRSSDGKTWDPRPGHPVAQLLQRVNDVESSDVLQRSWAVNMLTDGEVGWEIVPGREIWTRRANHFSVRMPKSGRRYMRVLGYNIDDNQGDPYLIPPEEFVHFKFYNPRNPVRGLTPISAIRTGVEIDEFARAWSRMFFKNSARPDYIAIAPQGTTSTEREELRDSLEGDARTLDNWHRVVVLENGIVDVKALNLPPKDTEWLDQRRFSREEIGGMYGVPDELMGFGRDTYENFDTAMYVLWYFTLIPLVKSRDSTLTEHFRRTGDLRDNERIETDLSGVQVLQENVGEKIEQAHLLIADGTPPNLAYQTVGLDLDIGEAGNVGYMPISMIPVGSSPYVEPPAEQQRAMNKTMKAPEFGSDAHVKIWRRKEDRVVQFRAQMRRMLKREFQRQQNEIGRALRDQRAMGRGKAVDTPEIKQSLAEMLNLAAEKERFRVEFLPLLREALGSVALNELESLGIDIDFDLDRPEVRAELAGILNQFAEKVNDTTYSDLVDLFAEAEAGGETIPQIMERLSAYFEGRKSDASTERIARTTMTAVNSAGDDAAWQQSGVVQGSGWLTSIDGRERAAHRNAHGQERRLGELFEVGGELLTGPGDPNGSPENIINCRCTRVPIVR